MFWYSAYHQVPKQAKNADSTFESLDNPEDWSRLSLDWYERLPEGAAAPDNGIVVLEVDFAPLRICENIVASQTGIRFGAYSFFRCRHVVSWRQLGDFETVVSRARCCAGCIKSIAKFERAVRYQYIIGR